MAFIQHDTGVATFGNGVSSVSDNLHIYTAVLRQSPRAIVVFEQQDNNTPAQLVGEFPVHAETQNVTLVWFKGQLHYTALVFDKADSSRVFKHFPLPRYFI